MRADLTMPSISSSFLNCEKDLELIIRKLFVENKPYSEILKRLLVINQKDCLDNTTSEVYKRILQDMSLKKMREEGYIQLDPSFKMEESPQRKSHLYISLQNIIPNPINPQYRDYIIQFDIMCPPQDWDLGNYRLRPFKIAGYIDGILNGSKLNNIGKIQFLACKELNLDENFSGYTLAYYVTGNVEEDKKVND